MFKQFGIVGFLCVISIRPMLIKRKSEPTQNLECMVYYGNSIVMFVLYYIRYEDHYMLRKHIYIISVHRCMLWFCIYILTVFIISCRYTFILCACFIILFPYLSI